MIVVKLIGGLGNQMFQYAAGRALSFRCNQELGLDLSGFKQYTLRSFALNHFNIKARILNRFESLCIQKTSRSRYSNVFGVTNFIETELRYSDRFHDLTRMTYLDGYWQSEKYFYDYWDKIRDELSLKSPLSEKDEELHRIAQAGETAAFHVRRGDYVTHAGTNKTHGTCSIEYYRDAFDLLNSRRGVRTAFVFSDDIAWAKANLLFPGDVVYVDHNDGNRNFADLFLMSSCKHNVIANSSFSWWGAYLNKNQEKIVIAPKNWFSDASMDSSTICPDEWIRL